MADLDLDAIKARNMAYLFPTAPGSLDVLEKQDVWDAYRLALVSANDVPALVAEVERLRAAVAATWAYRDRLPEAVVDALVVAGAEGHR